MAALRPDRYISSVLAIDLDALYAGGVRNLLLDLDNTILPRGTYTVPPRMVSWIHHAQEKGFRLGFVSNNWHHTCHEIAASVGLPLVWKAMKPLPIAIIHARRKFGFERKSTILIGDQMVTDVWGAHLSGMKVIMVEPLVSFDLKHTLILRKLEKLFMRGMRPEDEGKVGE